MQTTPHSLLAQGPAVARIKWRRFRNSAPAAPAAPADDAVSLLQQLCFWKRARLPAAPSWCPPNPTPNNDDPCWRAHLALRATKSFSVWRICPDSDNISELWVFDVRDTLLDPLAAGIELVAEGSFLVESFQSTSPANSKSDPEFSLFIDAVMNSMERLFAKMGIVRLRNEFLFTPYFYGGLDGFQGVCQLASNTPMISVIPILNFVGSSLLFQFKIGRDGYRSLGCRDLFIAKENQAEVLLLPFGVSAKIVGSSCTNQSDHIQSNESVWSTVFGFPPDFIALRTSDELPKYVTVELSRGGVMLSFPTSLIVVSSTALNTVAAPISVSETHRADSCHDMRQYLDKFRDWRWSDAVVTMFAATEPTSGPKAVGAPVDYWRYMNPFQWMFDSSLADPGTVDQLIRRKEAAELAKTQVPQAIPNAIQSGAVNNNNAKPISIPIPEQILPKPPTLSPIRGGTDLDLNLTLNNTRNGSSDFSGLELDDIGDDDWGFFQAPTPAAPAAAAAPTTPAAAPTTLSTPAATTSSTTIPVATAASPAISHPACSPAAAYTPGLTTILSPAPFTPNYSGSSTTAVGVQPTPDPTTPGVIHVSEDPEHLHHSIDASMSEDATAMVQSHSNFPVQQHPIPTDPTVQFASSSHLHDPPPNSPHFDPNLPFNIASILIPPATATDPKRRQDNGTENDPNSPIDAGVLLPDCWRRVDLDFGLVWSRARDSATEGTGVVKYGVGGTYVYRMGGTRKRGASKMEERSKFMRVGEEEGSEDGSEESSGSESSGDLMEGVVEGVVGEGGGGDMMEEEEVLEDGEVVHPVGVQAGVGGGLVGKEVVDAGMGGGLIVARGEEEALLAVQIRVESMTIGRGSVWNVGGSGGAGSTAVAAQEASLLSLRPAFDNRLFQFFGTTLCDLFGSSSSSAAAGSAGVGDVMSVRGPLTIEQMFDFNELDRGASKYGKFQLKKKKRSEPILELLRMPNLTVEHNNLPISINPTSMRMWDKLSLSPICGTKNIEYIVCCPGGDQSLVLNVQRWFLELSNLWDFFNFGTVTPWLEYRLVEVGGFWLLRTTRPLASNESLEDVRIRAYSDSLVFLAQDLARCLSQRITAFSTANKPFTTNLVVFLLNPFPHRPQLNHQLHLLAARILMDVSKLTGLPLPFISQTIVPVVTPIHFVVPQTVSDASSTHVGIREFAFGLFSRCKHTAMRNTQVPSSVSASSATNLPIQVPPPPRPMSPNTGGSAADAAETRKVPPIQQGFSLHASLLVKQPAVLAAGAGAPAVGGASGIQSSSSGAGGGSASASVGAGAAAGLQLHRRLDGKPLMGSLSDPDRIMHVVYSVSRDGRGVGVCWCDSVGELVDSCWVEVREGGGEWVVRFLAEVWERTLVLLGVKGEGRAWGQVCWKIVVAAVVGGGVGERGVVSGEEVKGFEQFLEYLVATEDLEHQYPSISSVSFVSLNLDPPLSIVDPGAVAGQSGGGAAQYFLSSGEGAAANERKSSHVVGKELYPLAEVVSSNEERLIPDGPATYLFVSKNHRLPIGNPVQVSMMPTAAAGVHDSLVGEDGWRRGQSAPVALYSSLVVTEVDESPHLPLAGGYLISVPRRETTPPISQQLGSTPPGSSSTGQGKTQLMPPEGSKSVSLMEVALLHHVNFSAPAATCYPGWNSTPGAIRTGLGMSGMDQQIPYSSPTSSSASTPSGLNMLSNANTPVLVPATIKLSSGSPTTPAALALQQQQQQIQSSSSSSSQPSTPYNSTTNVVGSNTFLSNAPAPAFMHTVVLRDVMREYEMLRWVHGGTMFDGGVRNEPWPSAMARVGAGITK
ncbi:Mediator of RNA polymerase II transcription subunit 13-like [Podochytrium sp. JEL0797]|nr:Mediator of RNA polymerase II transcription subunit 13-like [Podochytrium sp. JEL0797]